MSVIPTDPSSHADYGYLPNSVQNDYIVYTELEMYNPVLLDDIDNDYKLDGSNVTGCGDNNDDSERDYCLAPK
jgi:hypothetical protein